MKRRARLEWEKRTISVMVEMYCRRFHSKTSAPCEACSALVRYAWERTERCRFGERKPVCSACPVHCYKPEMRTAVRRVMSYAGPRMIRSHPLLAVRFLLEKRRSAKAARGVEDRVSES